jgi:ABC-2 type transport system permease protein
VNISRRRVRAILVKELREYRHNGNLIYAMAILPLIFLVQPIIQVFTLPSSASVPLHHEHALLYMLAIPALVPATLSSYAIVGERLQGTLEPVLSTPIRRDEFLLGKALAAFLPSLVVAYLVFAVYIAIVKLFADPGAASGLIRGSDVLAQVAFTPLLALWSIWVGIAVSTRSSDPRNAGQLAVLATLPTVAITSLIAFNVIPPELPVAIASAAALLILIRIGGRVAAALFDRERLITRTK